MTDPLGGCGDCDGPSAGDVAQGVKQACEYQVPDGGAGTVGQAAGCAPDIFKINCCQNYIESVNSDHDGDTDACGEDPECKKWKDACDKTGLMN